jgi:hypothetical protein
MIKNNVAEIATLKGAKTRKIAAKSRNSLRIYASKDQPGSVTSRRQGTRNGHCGHELIGAAALQCVEPAYAVGRQIVVLDGGGMPQVGPRGKRRRGDQSLFACSLGRPSVR